jgi:adenylate cyclase
MGMNRKKWIRLGASVGAALLLALLAYGGTVRRFDRWFEDRVFQRAGAISGDVVVVGIDEYALEKIGPYNTWDRNVMASALEALNADPNNRPAVVAIDTLYASESDDPEADARLAKAAADLGNVVTGASAVFGSTNSWTENGEYQIDFYSVLAFEESYPALKAVTEQGHINAMYDTDGIMRHAVLYIDVPGGGRVYSMAARSAMCYAEQHGETLKLPETDARGHFYVSYTAKPGDFYDGISIASVIDGEVPAGYFADKIVLIGPYAVGLQDSIYTPIERARQMYGVEYQANVIEAILAENYKVEVSDLLQAIVLFVLCAAAFLLFLRLSMRRSAIAFAGLTVVSIGVDILLYELDYIVHPLWGPLSFLILYVAAIVVHYNRSRAERQRVQNMFQRYVDPGIVKEILREGTDSLGLAGKLCNIAVLFVDIRGFTTMSERLDPETVVSILNQYLGMTSDVIHRHGGTLDKFVGDCTMAFWGAPLPSEDPCYQACQTALDIQAGVAEISERLKETLGEAIYCGVGVNYGPAVVGNIGAESRMDFTAIGDTVNTSARLEANAPKEKIFISRSVADELGDRAETTSLGGTIKLKGKADGFEILTLDRLTDYVGYYTKKPT